MRFLLFAGALLAACSGSSTDPIDAPPRTADAPADIVRPADKPPLPPLPDGPPAARLMLSLTDLDLGTVNIGAMATNVVVVTNIGDLASAPLAVAVPASADFTSTTNCSARRLGIGETCAVTMQFVPTSVGAKTTTRTVTQMEGNPMPLTFTARGTGRLAPDAGPLDATRGGGTDGAPDASPDAPRPDAAPPPDRPPIDRGSQ